jgi:hypothetical protein
MKPEEDAKKLVHAIRNGQPFSWDETVHVLNRCQREIARLKALVVDHRKVLGFAPPSSKDIYDV